MSNSIKGLIVVLERDVKDEDKERVLNAIRMTKGVLSVAEVETEPNDFIIKERLRIELYSQVREVFFPEKE